jgi:hypothetical protein
MQTRSPVALLTVAALLAIAPALRADTVSFATEPMDGSISGPPGSTIGWGYMIFNDSMTMWFEPTNLSADVFTNGTPLNIFDFPILAPMTGFD